MKHYLFCVGALTVAGLLATSPARAESAQFYNLEGFGTWLDGNPETTTVTEDGTVALGPGIRERYEDAAASFSAAAPLGDEVVVARVDDAAVIAIDRAGKTREIFTPDETLVTSILTVGSDIYVAAGPPAKLYKVDSRGKSKVMFTPDADYIWDMTTDGNGNLYIATGAPGEVIRVSSRGKGETIFAPEQLHLRSITYDSFLGLFVGGGERGIVYRAEKPKDVKALPKEPEDRAKAQKNAKGFRALYDSGHPEITAIALQDNLAFVAAVTGAQALASAQGNEQQGGKRGKGPEVRSQLIRVGMDGTSEVLAGSNDEAIFDLIVDDKKQVLVATGATGRDDPRGRLYSIHPKRRKIGMVYQSPSRRITHLVQLPRDALAAVAAAGGRITHVTGGYSFKGEFFTVPFDANINARWGMLEVFGVWEKGTKVSASVRTGQTKVPDASWSDWSREVVAPGRVSPHSERGRYMQIRLRLEGDGKQTPQVHRVRIAYLRQNLPPFVREVVTLRKGLALLPIFQEQNKSKTVSLKAKANPETRSTKAPEKKAPIAGVRARQIEEDGAMTVKWVAEDPNGDELRYNLQVRGQGERSWRTVEGSLDQPFYTFHSSQFPDGHYQFRVEATDSPSNPDGRELSDSRDSRAVLVDNTPPKVEKPEIQLNGRRATARVVVADTVGPLVDGEYSLDGARFRPLLPDDGVLDGPGESFTIRLGELGPGAHTLTIRVSDDAENVGVGQTRFTVR